MTTASARTARSEYECFNCRSSIMPGHRYLRHVAFPGDEVAEEITRPWVMRECVECAAHRDFGADIAMGACGSYCCATTPCALPASHMRGTEGEHSCRRCPEFTPRPFYPTEVAS